MLKREVRTFLLLIGLLPGLLGAPVPVAARTMQTVAPVRLPAAPQPLPLTSAYPAFKPIRYTARSGDSLAAVARRFGLEAQEIVSPMGMPRQGFLNPGQILILPPRTVEIAPAFLLLPDQEIVYGPAAVGFDVDAYLQRAGGYLAKHQEYLRSTAWTTPAEVVTRIARENSVHPRLLLALLEYECGCVLGPLKPTVRPGYLLGVRDYLRNGLYGQLGWAANQLSIGYYGWRAGTLTSFRLADGSLYYPNPALNAGSVALQYYFAQRDLLQATQGLTQSEKQALQFQSRASNWQKALDPQTGFPALYVRMFGNVWVEEAEPLFPPGLQQPDLSLPFEAGRVWSYTSGPHKAWETEGALAALDFAPATYESGCIPSDAWITAVADGVVVRSDLGMVIQDLDDSGLTETRAAQADGREQTGWAILYMHVESRERVAAGTRLRRGDPIGHPSCEGGPATGTHLHIARKYNGEWIAADGPLSFLMDGWLAHAGAVPFEGTLTWKGVTAIAHPYGSFETRLGRPDGDRIWWALPVDKNESK